MVLENTIFVENLGRVRFVFEDADSYDSFENITQSYGLCLNQSGDVIIVRSPKFNNNKWLLPGGTLEKGETPEETLHREVMEEADIKIKDLFLIGGQRCYYLDKPKEKTNSQLRFACLVSDLLPQTIDPDNGFMVERRFVKLEELNSFIKWGSVGEHLAKRAKDWFENLKKD